MGLKQILFLMIKQIYGKQKEKSFNLHTDKSWSTQYTRPDMLQQEAIAKRLISLLVLQMVSLNKGHTFVNRIPN